MRAIQILIDEHRALREVLDALELVIECQRHDDRLEAQLALETLEWFERCADGLHQDREELGVFPRLAQRTPERAQPLLQELVRWHAREREQLEQMREQIEGAAYGDAWSRDSFAAAALDYIEVQRRHADLEDARLIPLALAVLTPEDDELLLVEYARLEQRYLRAGEPTPAESAKRLSACAELQALERGPALLPSRARRSLGNRGLFAPSRAQLPQESHDAAGSKA